MTQDQIIQMLRKVIAENQNYTTWTVSTPHLVALVNHAINEEREACAALCEVISDDEHYFGSQYADMLRARGQV
jgi:hypothetical protein